jgi:hypothetical protein
MSSMLQHSDSSTFQQKESEFDLTTSNISLFSSLILGILYQHGYHKTGRELCRGDIDYPSLSKLELLVQVGRNYVNW